MRWVEVPHACDWSIFLRQAQLFQRNGLMRGFDTDMRDDNTRLLLTTAQATFPNDPSWASHIGPFCHDYKPKTDRISIVSPPGTGLALSLFPEGKQKRLMFLACGAAVLLALFVAIARGRRWTVPAAATAFGLLCYTMMSKFVHDWSVHPSILLSAAAGYLTVRTLEDAERRSGLIWASLLGLAVGLSINFRSANALAAVGIACGLSWIFFHRFRLQIVATGVALAIGSAVGMIPTLIANAINAGHPFVSTYGSNNLAGFVFDYENFKSGVLFYFVNHQTVATFFAVALLSLIALLAMRRRIIVDNRDAILVAGLTSLMFTAGFFCAYGIRQWYYLAPGTIFAAAIATAVVVRSGDRRAEVTGGANRSPIILAGTALAAILAVMLYRVPVPISESYAKPDIDFALPPKSIVWAHSSAGHFSIYLQRQASVLLHTLSPDQRQKVIAALNGKGVDQFVVNESGQQEMIGDLAGRGLLQPAGRAFGNPVFKIVVPRAVAAQ